MALRGKLSIAHEYNDMKQCIYCGMYEWNVLSLSHVCTVERERMADTGKLESLASNLRGMADKIREKSSEPKFELIAERLDERAEVVDTKIVEKKKEAKSGK